MAIFFIVIRRWGRLQRQMDKRLLIQRLWLSYYNQTLYEKGIISERDYGKMKLKIEHWVPKNQ